MSGRCDFCGIFHSGGCSHPGRAENAALRERVKELESKHRKGFCMYCGEVFEYKDTSDESIKAVYEAALAHDCVCAKNTIVKERDALKAQLRRAKDFARDWVFLKTANGTHDFNEEWQSEVIEGK